MTAEQQWPPESAERVTVVARLKRSARDGAAQLISAGPPFEPAVHGFVRHSVCLSGDVVVFYFEGAFAGRRLAEVVEQMIASEFFNAWAPLLEGAPQIAHEYYFWET